MKKSMVVLFLLMSTFLNAEDKTANGATTAPAPPPPPPVAKPVHTENHINGGKLVDDYRWLRDKSNLTQGLETELKEPAICLLLWTSRILRTLCSKVLKSSSRACDKCLSPSSRSSMPLLELSSFAFSKWLLASV